MGSCTHIVDDKKILNQYEYDVWGNVVNQKETIKNRFKFNGQQLDPITQQYYLRARFYNPVIARFTQEDTYRGDGLNLYSYCANNPIYYVDPSGNACDPTNLTLNNVLNVGELKVLGINNKNKTFTRIVEFNAGIDGTNITYKVYQRNDIDWNMIRRTRDKRGRGLTNAEAAVKYGLAPILKDGSIATLHHSQQKSIGPLFEASTRYHKISNAKKPPLHPYRGKLNPFYPMDSDKRSLFQSVDSIAYWKARGRDAMKGIK